MTILVLGSSGQLATQLREYLPEAEFWGRADQDIADPASLRTRIRAMRPRAIINAAAYTAVDAAESDRVAAWRLNAEAPAAAAEAAADVGATLVQVSTDYVFDGHSRQPYTSDAPVNPLSVYGASKLAGEIAVRTLCARHWVLRTSWIFSEHGSNFVRSLLRLADGEVPLRIVADQYGRPTYAGDLAALIAAIDVAADEPRLPFGIWHATGGPIVTWHDFAQRIFARAQSLGLLDRVVEVAGTTTAQFGAIARRPLYGVLLPDDQRWRELGISFDWESGLDRVLKRIGIGGVVGDTGIEPVTSAV
jgi:dTDP-4-dehydrorhamnose reductase